MAAFMVVVRDPSVPGVTKAVQEFFSWQDVFTDIFHAGSVKTGVVEVIERTGATNVNVLTAAALAPVAVKVHEWADVNQNWRSALP